MRRATASADVSDALAAAAAAAAHRQQLQQRISFHVGVLHFTPSSEPFPLLADAVEVSTLLMCGPSCVLIAVRMDTAWACILGGTSGYCSIWCLRFWCCGGPCLQYNPSTIDINNDAAEMAYWIGVLQARPLLHACSRAVLRAPLYQNVYC